MLERENRMRSMPPVRPQTQMEIKAATLGTSVKAMSVMTLRPHAGHDERPLRYHDLPARGEPRRYSHHLPI